MNRLSSRRLRVAIALLAPALAGTAISGSDLYASERLSEFELTEVVVQPVQYQGDEVVEAPVHSMEAQPAADQPMVDPMQQPASEPVQMSEPVTSYESFAPAPMSCQCECKSKCCCTDEKKEAATAAMKNAYAGLFFANNFDYLDDPCYDGPHFPGESLKNMDTAFGKLSIGGESRFRYHNERNHRGLGITGNDDQFWLFRQRIYADLKINDTFRVFAEGLHARSLGETFNPRPIEENDMDIQNLFVDVNLISGDSGKLSARLGRQELLYGAQRTVSPLDWANTRRTFEGVKFLYQNENTQLDAFWTEPVNVEPRQADEGDNNQQFYGAYLTQQNTPMGQLEAYYLGFENQTVDFNYQTVGGRASGKTDGGVLYDFEGAYQFGENSNGSEHFAGFVTAGLGRKIETKLWSPTVWLYYDYASGEDDFDEVGRGDNGFDHLFPLAHKYNGFMDLFGRRNLHDWNILSVTPLGKKVSMILWYHYFTLAEDTTPYSVVLTPFNTTEAAGDRELGHEIDVLFNINVNPRNNILLGYSHFSAGDYYDTTGGLPAGVDQDADADFFYAQFQTSY